MAYGLIHDDQVDLWESHAKLVHKAHRGLADYVGDLASIVIALISERRMLLDKVDLLEQKLSNAEQRVGEGELQKMTAVMFANYNGPVGHA